ncbi:hypothetical protein EDD18DRAFT_1151511 [Armillaria luteobubalina]|uniref:ubiquitinyl hydrolase 1 n=1 Tax=Armillaria luteobubalina TaxID=153913 RepID=A0AA39QCV5_9AGAR|nr:hypothetical protein EDD18DRAFT_1151511 [Armillaria luteobubalina]
MSAFTIRDILLQTVSSSLFQQLFPFVVLFLVPVLVLSITSKFKYAPPHYPFVMGSLGFSMPWNWFSNSGNGSVNTTNGRPGHHHHEKRKSKKSKEKIELVPVKTEEAVDDGYYPGLVNISGTYCFMDSTVQALSSLSYLQPQIDAVHSKAETLDVPTPVIDALQDLFHRLNTQTSAPSSIRPVELISVLSSPSSARFNSLFNSREHQDAQELFQLVSECIKNETISVDKEGLRDRGLNALSQEAGINPEIGKSVFDGLTANRRSCVICGYTEAVMHFAFDNWQLAVPRMAMSCTLEDCLEEYTRLEVLRDCICRRCSMLSTHRRLMQEVEALKTSRLRRRKRRLKDVRKMEIRVKAALDEGRIEDELKDIRMEKVFSSMSTKQAMIARPPPVLVLHINRSVHYSHYAAKNNIRVIFPEVLDLTPFTTSGNLSTVPTSSLSTPSILPPRSSTPTPTTYTNLHYRTIYRLSAVVCHYGQHSFGHYVCFRRKPPNSNVQDRWKPPKIIIKDSPSTSVKREDDSGLPVEFEWEDADSLSSAGTGKGWLRISDNTVDECGIEGVLREGSGAFMLYYERAVLSPSTLPEHHPYTTANGITNGYAYGVGTTSPESSEETLKPEMMMMMTKLANGNGNVRSLVSINGTLKSEDNEKTGSISESPPSRPGPRVVRSVAAGRGRRSSSVTNGLQRTVSASPPLASPSKPISILNGHGPVKHSDTDPMMISSISSSAPASLFSPKPPTSRSTSPATSHQIEPHNHKPESPAGLQQ